MNTKQGEVRIPTDAVMAHTLDARLGSEVTLQNTIENVNECAANDQAVTLTYREQYGKRISDITIVKEPVGLAMLLPSNDMQ